MLKFGRSEDNNEKTIEIDLLSLLSVCIIVIMGVLLLFGAFNFFKQFLSVSKFDVSGISSYEALELAGTAGIKKGDRLYGFDKKEAEQRLLDSYVYIDDVEIKRIFPNKVRFVVEERVPVWYLEISGDYYILDGEMRVLEETKDIERIKRGNICKLSLPSPNNVIEGEIISYGKNDVEKSLVDDIVRIIVASDIRPRLSYVDIENIFNINFQIDGKLDADIGPYDNLEVKLVTIFKALMAQKEDAERAISGNISITGTGDACAIRFKYPTDNT